MIGEWVVNGDGSYTSVEYNKSQIKTINQG